MTLNEILTKLTQLGVHISVDGDKLRVRAPKHKLTPELRNSLADYKTELLTLLRQREIGSGEINLVPIPRSGEIHASYAQQRMWVLNKLSYLE